METFTSIYKKPDIANISSKLWEIFESFTDEELIQSQNALLNSSADRQYREIMRQYDQAFSNAMGHKLHEIVGQRSDDENLLKEGLALMELEPKIREWQKKLLEELGEMWRKMILHIVEAELARRKLAA